MMSLDIIVRVPGCKSKLYVKVVAIIETTRIQIMLVTKNFLNIFLFILIEVVC